MPRYRVPFDGASGSVWVDAPNADLAARYAANAVQLSVAHPHWPHDRTQIDVASFYIPKLETTTKEHN